MWQRLEPTCKNAKLTVNLGACHFKALPFACSTFADIATEDHRSPVSDENRVVVFIGLPGEGVFDFRTASWKNPGYCELVIERFVLGQLLVVLSPRKRVAEMTSNFPLKFLPLTKLYQADVEDTAMLNNRSCVVTSIRSNPLLVEWSC